MSNYSFKASDARYMASRKHDPEVCPPKELFDAIELACEEGMVYPPKAIGRPLTGPEWTWMCRRGYKKGYKAPDFFDAPCIWGIKQKDSPILLDPKDEELIS